MMPTVVILAGGLAVRLGVLTKNIPKSLIELEGRPFIRHQLEILKKNDVKRVVICLGYLGEMIQDYIHTQDSLGLEIEFSFEGPNLLGTAGAIKKACALLEKNFAVMYGDSYLTEDFRPAAKTFAQSDKKALMTVLKNEGRWGPSNILFSDEQIITYDKNDHVTPMKHIDYGFLFFKKQAFERIADDQVYDLAILCQELIKEHQMAAYEVHQRFYEIGSVEGLQETRSYLRGH